MEVKKGYKQTDIGVIPSDWILTSIGKCATTSSGTTPARNLFDRYYKNGTISWTKTLDLNNSYITRTEERVTQTAMKETCLQCYPPGTVVVAMYGGFNQIGRTGLLNIPAAVNQALTAIQCQPSRLAPDFLLRILNYRVDYWKSVASSSRKDPNITGKEIRDFPIPLPTLAEQEAIATALSDADAWIESLEQLIAKKGQIKQGAMQELLTGKRRLPGFEVKQGFKRTEVGVIPANWCLRRGCEITTLIGKGASPRWQGFDYTESGMLFVTSENVRDGFLDVSKPKYLTLDFHAKLSRTQIQKFDILINLVGGSIGRSCQVLLDLGAANVNQAVAVFRSTPSVSSQYIYHHLQFVQTKKRILDMQVDAARQNISLSNVRDFLFVLPRLAEQEAIATALSDMDTEITTLETKLTKARQIKQGMMQELLTGRIRLI